MRSRFNSQFSTYFSCGAIHKLSESDAPSSDSPSQHHFNQLTREDQDIGYLSYINSNSPPQRTYLSYSKAYYKDTVMGIPGWLSSLVPAFGSGCDPGDPGSSPTSGSLPEACFSLCLCLCLSLSLSLSVSLSRIN